MPRLATTYNEQLKMVTMRCGNCGIVFGMPDFLQQDRAENGGTFYCPNGHPRVYRESDVDRLGRELREAQAQVVSARDQLAAEKRARLAAQRRVGNGVCPCCKRTFVQLQRHMTAKHPDYKAKDG